MTVSYRRERLDRGVKARCDDIFALSSYREACYLWLPRVLPVAFLLLFPLFKEVVGLYWAKVLGIACIVALLALSWDLIASVGLISLGQALFFGVGAYMSAYLNRSLGWSPLFAVPVATLIGALFCTLLVSPLLRLRGIYFVLITLVLPLFFLRVIEATKILGGTEGISGLTYIPNIWVELYVPVIAVLLVVFSFRRLINTDYGMVLRGIRDNDRTVIAGGINIHWYKLQVVFIAGVVGCFAGAFMAHCLGAAAMSMFSIDYSILSLTAAIVGGPGTFAGATLGAFIMVPLSEILRTFGGLRVVFYCVILVIFIVGLPEGIFHYIQRKYHQFERLVEVEVKR